MSDLTFTGSIGFTNGVTPLMYIFQSGSANPDRPIISHSPSYPNWGLAYRDNGDQMIFQSNGAAVMVLDLSTQKVGIGATAPSEKLEVVGNIKVSGTVIQASSRTLKENVADLSGSEAIEALENLNPVKFNYKADDEKNLHIGFIAEDVPDLVATTDRKGLSAMDIVAVLTKAMKEQQKTITVLTEKVKMLEAQTS
jgi:hypothetical protein